MVGIMLLFVTLFACVFADDITFHPDVCPSESIFVCNPDYEYEWIMENDDYDNDNDDYDYLGPVILYNYSAYYFI